MKNSLYWKEYVNMENAHVYGYFNRRFSDKIPLGRIKKLNTNPVLYETVFTIDPRDVMKFEKFEEAKEWVEQQLLLWVMRGHTLEPYYTKDAEDDEEEEKNV